MNSSILKLARLGALALAFAIVPTVLPASAQTSNHMNDNAAASQNAETSNGAMVPGTGMTLAELRDLGYTQQQIADIRSTEIAGAAESATDQNPATASNTNNAETNPNSPQANNANTGGGGGGWGLWGLVGLLGLLGLGRGRRAETVRTDRDVRRVA